MQRGSGLRGRCLRGSVANVAGKVLQKKVPDGGGAGKRAREEGDDAAGASPAQSGKAAKAAQPSRDPRSVVIWNANGLHLRLESDGQKVRKFLEQRKPDALLLSEVWLKGASGAQGEVCLSDTTGRHHQDLWARAVRGGGTLDWFSSGAKQLTLHKTKRSAGSAMLTRDEARPLRTWCYLPSHDDIVNGVAPLRAQHDPEGRILLIEWPSLLMLHQYVPNNGSTAASAERRERWDQTVREWLRTAHQRRELFRKFARIVFCGDLNVAPLDADVSHPDFFRKQGVRTLGVKWQGQPGFTPREQDRFRQLLHEAGLVDAFRHFQDRRDVSERAGLDPHATSDAIFTWRGRPATQGNAYTARYQGRCASTTSSCRAPCSTTWTTS